MFLENTTFITTVESIKITVEQYVTVQSHFCSCIITKVAAWLCFCVTVPTGIYVCCLTHREQVHGGPTNHSQWILPVGGRLSFFYSLYFGIATCFTMSMHCFCNEKTTGKKKKTTSKKKIIAATYKIYRVQVRHYAGPLTGAISSCAPRGSKCGTQIYYIPGKETEAWRGHTVSKWQGQDPTRKPHSDYPCDVTLSHLQSIGERVCIPHGNVSRLSWAASQWKKAAAGRSKELRQLGVSPAWAEHPFAMP